MIKNCGSAFYCIAGLIVLLIHCTKQSSTAPQTTYTQWVTQLYDNFQGPAGASWSVLRDGGFEGSESAAWLWSDTSGGILHFPDSTSKNKAIAGGHVRGMTFLKGAEISESIQISTYLQFSSIDSNSAGVSLIDSAAKRQYIVSVGRDNAGRPAPGDLTILCLSIENAPTIISAAHNSVPGLTANVPYQLVLTLDSLSMQGKLLLSGSPIDSIVIGSGRSAPSLTSLPDLWAGIDLEGTRGLPLSAETFTVSTYYSNLSLYTWRWSDTSAIRIDAAQSNPLQATGNVTGAIQTGTGEPWNVVTDCPLRISMDFSLSSIETGAAAVWVFDSMEHRRYWLILGNNGIGQSASGALSLIVTAGDTSRVVINQAHQSIQDLSINSTYRLVLTFDSSRVSGELQLSGSVEAKTQIQPGPLPNGTNHMFIPGINLSGTASSPSYAGFFQVETYQRFISGGGGSCPFIYSFDGAHYVGDAEPYGGSICKGLQRTEWCALDHLKAVRGVYNLLMTNELDEIQYTDELKLLVVDHPRDVRVIPDVSGGIHTFSRPFRPLSARDRTGEDIRVLCCAKDGRCWIGSTAEFDPDGKDEPSDTLTFRFAKPDNATSVKVLVNAGTTDWGAAMGKRFLSMYGSGVGRWYDAVDKGGKAYERIMNWYRNEELYMLKLQVATREGWKTRANILGAGPVVAADRAYVVDIHDVPGDTLILRLSPPAGFWKIDWIAADYSQDAPVAMHEISPVRAFNNAGKDVRLMLDSSDTIYHVAEKGDTVRMAFSAPPVTQGLSRTVVLKANGYYKMHLRMLGLPEIALLANIEKPGFCARYALKEYRRLEQSRTR